MFGHTWHQVPHQFNSTLHRIVPYIGFPAIRFADSGRRYNSGSDETGLHSAVAVYVLLYVLLHILLNILILRNDIT